MKIIEWHAGQTLLTRVLLAVLFSLLAVLSRFWLLPLESDFPFLTIYPLTVLCFFLCGIGPGLLMSILCAISAYYLFVPPFQMFKHNPSGEIDAANYLLTALLMGVVVKQLQQAIRQLTDTLSKLKDSEARFQSFMNNSGVIAWMKDGDGRYVYLNKAFEERLNVNLAESPDTTGTTGFEPDAHSLDDQFSRNDLTVLASSQPVVVEETIQHQDGTLDYWLITKFVFIDDHDQHYVGGIGADITRQKLLEARLADSMHEIEDLYNHAPCGYHSVNADGTILLINETELNWLGLKREDVAGKMHVSDFLTEEGKSLFQQTFPEFLKN